MSDIGERAIPFDNKLPLKSDTHIKPIELELAFDDKLRNLIDDQGALVDNSRKGQIIKLSRGVVDLTMGRQVADGVYPKLQQIQDTVRETGHESEDAIECQRLLNVCVTTLGRHTFEYEDRIRTGQGIDEIPDAAEIRLTLDQLARSLTATVNLQQSGGISLGEEASEYLHNLSLATALVQMVLFDRKTDLSGRVNQLLDL